MAAILFGVCTTRLGQIQREGTLSLYILKKLMATLLASQLPTGGKRGR